MGMEHERGAEAPAVRDPRALVVGDAAGDGGAEGVEERSRQARGAVGGQEVAGAGAGEEEVAGGGEEAVAALKHVLGGVFLDGGGAAGGVDGSEVGQVVEGDVQADGADATVAVEKRGDAAHHQVGHAGERMFVVGPEDDLASQGAWEKIPAAELAGVVSVAAIEAKVSLVAMPAGDEASGGVLAGLSAVDVVAVVEGIGFEDGPDAAGVDVFRDDAVQQFDDERAVGAAEAAIGCSTTEFLSMLIAHAGLDLAVEIPDNRTQMRKGTTSIAHLAVRHSSRQPASPAAKVLHDAAIICQVFVQDTTRVTPETAARCAARTWILAPALPAATPRFNGRVLPESLSEL